MKQIEPASITSVKGFMAAGFSCGLKKHNKKDLALIYTAKPTASALVVTQNKVKAAPLLTTHKHAKTTLPQAIIINSGNANACTGELGLKDANKMCELTAQALNIPVTAVYVLSTGVIGVPMPMDKITNGISQIAKKLDINGGKNAAEAIMTTDTFTKEICVEITLGNSIVRIAGMAKGSGMIHPNMATMLGIITTDVAIEQTLLQQLFNDSVKDTYNMVSVDGDTSTNDCAIIVANGAANNHLLTDLNHPDTQLFKHALFFVNQQLAMMIAKDGEGATKLLEVQIKQAKTDDIARKLAKTVVSSSLVKTAMFGNDANWGRVLCALGYSNVEFNPDTVDLYFQSTKGLIQVMEHGQPVSFDENLAFNILNQPIIKIIIHLNQGKQYATAWGCDLTHEYIRINATYRT